MTSDKALQQAVQDELGWEPSLNATHIGVAVGDGVVTLSGQVESFAEKWAAESAAQRVYGVRALAVELTVDLPSTAERADSDIARSVISTLEWMNQLPAHAVQVVVEKGQVTLNGSLDWEYQRELASSAVRHLLGVRGLHNQIVLKPKVKLSAVKADIELALQRRAEQDAQDIQVRVDGAEVTLSGTVHSWSERNLATHTAWGTPGVHRVVDQLTFA